MLIGVLALQGDFREHLMMLQGIGVDAVEVKTVEVLNSCRGLVLPGGESTVIEKLAENYGLARPIREKIQQGMPAFGTCAGLILLANEILDGIPGQTGFGGLDISVRRNAFGNQLDSFETDLNIIGVSGPPVRAAFIRAPVVERVGDSVEVISRLTDNRIVGVRSKNILGISFHPEVSGEERLHRMFVEMVSRRAD